jgi:uncharacterized repeat protein (TIGR01451 family)
MNAAVTPTPTEWVVPIGATGSSATNLTSRAGFATFQWNTPDVSSIVVSEVAQPTFTNVPAATNCRFRTPDQPADQPLAIVPANGSFTAPVIPNEAIVTCEMFNVADPAPAITIKKYTNGYDADTPPGPSIALVTRGVTGPGQPIIWTYVVTNPGNVTLRQVAVTDDQGLTVTCPASTLGPGEDMTCTASGTALAGQYANTGVVTGEDAFGTVVSDSDPSHYFGVAPGIDLVKQTNGQDAEVAPGPYVPLGDPVTWTYLITNTGGLTLDNIVVTDDQLGPVLCPLTTLAAGIDMTCTAAGTAQQGQYENQATVVGTTPGGTQVTDQDISHYFGAQPDIDVEKLTNLNDADIETGPLIPVDGAVDWLYVVTNTGNVSLGWSVVDDQIGPLACPRIGTLAPGGSVTCRAHGVATAGQYENEATATGTFGTASTVTDTDLSHYFGFLQGIDIEKATNGADADTAPGPLVPIGDPIVWTYAVTNTSNRPITNVSVTDDVVGSITCPFTQLDPGDTMTCNTSGTAELGQYVNLATVTAIDALGDTLTDTDPSHYFGLQPGIDLEKLTNGDDADQAPGPLIEVGEPVEWTYIVANNGNDALEDITVDDDQLGAVSCPQTTLQPAESMTCTATGTAQIDQYENLATVTGVSANNPGQTLTDSDPSHYFGVVSDINIIEFVNGEDANEPPGVQVAVGAPIIVTSHVTNPGNIPVRDVEVSDDKGRHLTFSHGDSDGDDELDPGETWIYEDNFGLAPPGTFGNLATVNGIDVLEVPLTDDDPAFIFAQAAPTTTQPPTVLPPATAPPPPVVPTSPLPPSGLPPTGRSPIEIGTTAMLLILCGTAVTTLVRRRPRPR